MSNSLAQAFVSRRVRNIYERRPYPFGNSQALKKSAWSLAAEWVETLGRAAVRGSTPGRILVAGCGDGTEAFTLARQYPEAEMVAVDFSWRSIGVAQQLQRRRKQTRSIRFLQADLTDARLADHVGRNFELITCHGVLSYIPGPGNVFRNLARCLAPTGVLYLGVNGVDHLNMRMRVSLSALGLDPKTYADTPRVGEVLRLCEEVLVTDGFPRFTKLGRPFLASDVFGPFNQCLSLAEWAGLAEGAGLFLRGNWAAIPLFQKVAEQGREQLLRPRTRAEVCRFFEHLHPTRFHRLLFSRTPEPAPPWSTPRELARWHPTRTSLYRVRLPRPAGPIRDRLTTVRIGCSALDLRSQWQMAEWEAELLRRADGQTTLGRILRDIPLAVPAAELRKQLYLLYQLGILNVLPPVPA